MSAHRRLLILLGLIFFSPLMLSAQKLLVESVFIDSSNSPHLVERKYIGEDSAVHYVTHDNAGYPSYHHSFCTTIREKHIADTLVHEEITSEILDFPDSIVLSGIDRLGSYKTTFNWDSMKPLRITKKYYTHSGLIEVEYIDSINAFHNKAFFKYTAGRITIEIYNITSTSAMKMGTDTIIINKDTTEIKWKGSRGGRVPMTTYFVNGHQMKEKNGSDVSTLEFNGRIGLQQVLEWHFLTDPQILSLFVLDKIQLNSMNFNGSTYKMDYSRDASDRISRISYSENGNQKYYVALIYK